MKEFFQRIDLFWLIVEVAVWVLLLKLLVSLAVPPIVYVLFGYLSCYYDVNYSKAIKAAE